MKAKFTYVKGLEHCPTCGRWCLRFIKVQGALICEKCFEVLWEGEECDPSQ